MRMLVGTLFFVWAPIGPRGLSGGTGGYLLIYPHMVLPLSMKSEMRPGVTSSKYLQDKTRFMIAMGLNYLMQLGLMWGYHAKSLGGHPWVERRGEDGGVGRSFG